MQAFVEGTDTVSKRHLMNPAAQRTTERSRRWSRYEAWLSIRWLLVLAMLIASSGATCMPWTGNRTPEAGPVVFDRTPTLGEVIHRVNANTLAVRTLFAESVRISAPGVPTLKATLAIELPRRMRLQGDLLLSRELDIGSNEELFWLWGKNWTGALLYARHDQLHLPEVRRWVPWEPQWFLEALGLAYLSPTGQHHGPYAHGPGAMEVHTQVVTPAGDVFTKVTVIHAVYGWILQQQLRNDRGQVVAVARLSEHRFYADAGVTLPDVIEIEAAPGTPEASRLKLDIGGYQINQPIENQELFALPVIPDYPSVNLADPQAVSAWRTGWSQQGSPPKPSPPQAYRPEYRGYTRR